MPSWNTFLNEPMASGAQFLPFFFRQFQNRQKIFNTSFACLHIFRDFCFSFDAHFQRPFFSKMKKLFAQLTEAAHFFFCNFSHRWPRKIKKLCCDQMLKFQHGTGQKISRTSQISRETQLQLPSANFKNGSNFFNANFQRSQIFVGKFKRGKMGGFSQHNFFTSGIKKPKNFFGSGSIPFNHEPNLAVCT